MTETASVVAPAEPRSVGVARRVRGLMAELQITQGEVAFRLGFSQQSMSRRHAGITPFTVDEVQQLASVLRTSEDYLYGLTNDKSPRPVNPDEGDVRHQGLEPRTR